VVAVARATRSCCVCPPAERGAASRDLMPLQQDIADVVDRVRTGDPRAVARLISMVEDASPRLREVVAALAPDAGRARVIGITGPPGVGKSTTTSALVAELRRRGQKVGVLAIDPSSPFSGGALLGDRVRMSEHATDSGVFIRSMATRGHLGGLSWATPQAIRVLDAAGCDVVIVETVGVGQSEIEVVSLADTTLVLLAPGMGDGVQAAKAGILEIADVFAVNKADRDGAAQTVRDLRYMLSLGSVRDHQDDSRWAPPIVRTTASSAEGIDRLLAALDGHWGWLERSGERGRRRAARIRAEIESIAVAHFRERIRNVGAAAMTDLANRVVAGGLDPYAAADELLHMVSTSLLAEPGAHRGGARA
jgi:GTPase